MHRLRPSGESAGSLPAVSVSNEGPAGSAGHDRAAPAKNSAVSPRPQRVEPVSLAVLLARADARLIPEGESVGDSGDVLITGATLRAQQVLAGDVFAALPGARAHGADFAEEAIANGAAAVLTDEAGAQRTALRDADVPVLVHDDPRGVLGSVAAWIYGEPSLRLAVLGVTGTAGKTTTAYLIEAGLRAAGHTTGLIGTVETRIAGTRLSSALTTPEAPDLQALLAVMAEQGVTHVAMEVSSHALALGRVNGIRFAAGAFTNLSQDHLDFHRDMDEYFAAKSLLFDGRSTAEVVVIDSSWGRALVTPRTVTVSTEPAAGATWTATNVRTTRTGEQSFMLGGPTGTAEVTVGLPGTFNVINAVLAAAVLDTADIALEDIVAGFADVGVPGRMERVDVGQDFTAVVDYAHKPVAVAQALDALRARVDGKVITVLGCGGDRDSGKRPMMGEAAARRSEVLIVTDDNPRGEPPAAIRAAVLDGARTAGPQARSETREIGDRREAIAVAVELAGPGDVVLVAGKGHEHGQEIGGVLHPFSDRDELEAAIGNRRGVSA